MRLRVGARGKHSSQNILIFSLGTSGDTSTRTLKIIGRSLWEDLSVSKASSLALSWVDGYCTFSFRTEMYEGKIGLMWSVMLNT